MSEKRKCVWMEESLVRRLERIAVHLEISPRPIKQTIEALVGGHEMIMQEEQDNEKSK